jgi:PKD repeat protein
MQIRFVPFFILGAIAGTPPVLAQPPSPPPATEIDHKGVACIVVAKYPKLKACFGGQVVEPRAYFHAEGDRAWYWVKMVTDLKDAPEPLCRTGVLPKPGRKLLHRHVEYYLEDVGGGQRTKEYDPLVVKQARECKKDAPMAPISPTGPAAVFPAVPAGFTVGAFPTAAVGVATAAAAGTGVYFATKKNETTPTTPTAPAPVPPAPASPTPPPATPPPATPPLDLSCQAEPKSGVVPLTVTFTAFASGGTGSYDYAWQFGDGGTGVGRHPVHTYTSIGTFDVVLTVTSGDKVRQCERFITVNAPPTPSPPTTAKLTFTSLDEGDGCGPKVNITPPNKDCVAASFGPPGTTCSQTYASGTIVTITAFPTTCDGTVCWQGDCLKFVSAPVCTLTMDTDKVAGARFASTCITSAEPPVSLTWNVDLDASGAVGQVVVDGQLVVAETGRRVQQPARNREGEVIVAGHLVRADGKPGTWRFEAQQGEAIEPGSLRVQQGDVALLTPTAIVFRLKGEAGERVSFSYRLRR